MSGMLRNAHQQRSNVFRDSMVQDQTHTTHSMAHAPNEGASCKAHLLNPVKLVEPGGVVSCGHAALAFQAVMTVHQPGLQLLALRAKAHLQSSSIPTSALTPCQAHPAEGPCSVPLQVQAYQPDSITSPLQSHHALLLSA